MDNENKKKLNLPEEQTCQEEDKIVVLFNERGVKLFFSILSTVEDGVNNYLVLIPFSLFPPYEIGGESKIGIEEVCIVQKVITEGGEKVNELVKNQDLIKKIFNLFQEKMAEEEKVREQLRNERRHRFILLPKSFQSKEGIAKAFRDFMNNHDD